MVVFFVIAQGNIGQAQIPAAVTEAKLQGNMGNFCNADSSPQCSSLHNFINSLSRPSDGWDVFLKNYNSCYNTTPKTDQNLLTEKTNTICWNGAIKEAAKTDIAKYESDPSMQDSEVKIKMISYQIGGVQYMNNIFSNSATAAGKAQEAWPAIARQQDLINIQFEYIMQLKNRVRELSNNKK